MSSVFRIRPCNKYTIDEIENHYLWFSRRTGFNDPEDANIGAYLDNNKVLLNAFNRLFTSEEIKVFREEMDCTGICCFTDRNPSDRDKGHYPGGKRCICIEYDRELLESYFLNSHYAIANCFNVVHYFDSPIIFEQDGEYHILTKKDEDGCLYESVKELTRTEKNMDRLIKLLLTRINSKYHFQDELRIILGGRNIPTFDNSVSGYKVPIPKNAIKMIHLYKDTNKKFKDSLFKKGFQTLCSV